VERLGQWNEGDLSVRTRDCSDKIKPHPVQQKMWNNKTTVRTNGKERISQVDMCVLSFKRTFLQGVNVPLPFEDGGSRFL
jgi:hypothetical protein